MRSLLPDRKRERGYLLEFGCLSDSVISSSSGDQIDLLPCELIVTKPKLTEIVLLEFQKRMTCCFYAPPMKYVGRAGRCYVHAVTWSSSLWRLRPFSDFNETSHQCSEPRYFGQGRVSGFCGQVHRYCRNRKSLPSLNRHYFTSNVHETSATDMHNLK